MREMHRVIETAELAFRPGETRKYYTRDMLRKEDLERPGMFAVMIVEVPNFPGDRHPESTNFAIVCAASYECVESERPGEYLWGWVHLTASTKEALGQDLLDIEAKPGKWYYLEMTRETTQ